MTAALERVEQEAYSIEALRSMISPYVARTAVEFYDYVGYGNEVYAKLETTQVTGSFKVRGGVASVIDELQQGAVRRFLTNSAGNYGAGKAYAGSLFGIPTDVYLRKDTPESKKQNITRVGGTLKEVNGTLEDAARIAHARHSKYERYSHPYDTELVALAHGTPALELLEDYPDLERIFVPVGGGGLVAGTVAAVAEFGSRATVVGVQYSTNISLENSLASNTLTRAEEIDTSCEGTAVRQIGQTCLDLLGRYNVPFVTMRVTAADVGREIVREDRRRQPLVADLGEKAFEHFPEPTAFVAAAGARTYAENHPDEHSQQWGIVLTGSNGDPEKEKFMVDAYFASVA